jgi:hypothetical protein
VPDLLGVTLEDMIAEVRRECQQRRHVYDRLVRERKMNRRLADRRIDVMDALLAYLEKQHHGQETAG